MSKENVRECPRVSADTAESVRPLSISRRADTRTYGQTDTFPTVRNSLVLTSQALRGVTVGPHTLAIPGRHEARALTDCCPTCMTYNTPVAVLDARCRHACYRCRCGDAWLCTWDLPR